MAGDITKKLLIKSIIDTTSWNNTVKQMRASLDAINEKAKADAANMKTTQKQQIDLTRQQILEEQRLTAEAKKLQAVDSARAAWQKQQQEAVKTTIQQRVLETAEAKKQQTIAAGNLRLEQERLRILQQQLKLTEQHTKAQARASVGTEKKGGEGGILGGLGRFASNLAGGGLIGGIAGGVLTGGLIGGGVVELLDSAGAKIRSLGEALVDATGPAVQLREQFEKLAARAGSDPDEYLNKLRVATRGLADDVSLYRIANNFMQQGLKVSNEDITRLVKATVDLARAQGKDAVQATNALERASKTGRMQQLAMVTGLTRQELALRGVSAATDPVIKNTMQFNQVLAALEAREKAVGTPAATLPELLKQWDIVQKNLMDDMAVSIARSTGFKNVVSGLSEVITEIQPKLSAFVEWVGSKIGDSLEVVTPMLKFFLSTLHLVGAEIGAWAKLGSVFFGVGGAIDKLREKTDPFRTFISDMSIGFLTMAEYVNEAAIKITHTGNILDAVMHGKFEDVRKINAAMDQEIQDSRIKYGQDVLDAAKFRFGPGKTPAAGKQQDVYNNIAAAKQEQQLQLQIAKETAQLKYELEVEYSKRRLDLVKQDYENGRISLEQEVNREKQIFAEEHAAKMKEIDEEHKAQLANITKTAKETAEPSKITNEKIQKENLRAHVEGVKETTSFQEKNAGLDRQLDADKEAARVNHEQRLTEIAKEGIETRQSLLEKNFNEGLVSADEYLAKRRTLIIAEYLAVESGLNAQLGAAKKSAAEEQKIADEQDKNKEDRNKKLALLDQSEDEVRLKALQTRYQLQTKPLQTQVNIARGDVTGKSFGIEEGAQQALLVANQEHLQDLLRQTPKAGSDAWDKQQDDIEKTILEIQKLNKELRTMHDTAGMLGGIFGSVSGLAGLFPRSKSATSTAQWAGNMQGSMQNLSAFSQFNSAIQQKSQDEGGGPSNAFSSLGKSFTDLFSSTKSASEKLNDFGKDLSGVIQGVMGLIQGLTSGKTGFQGALGGATAGAQFGKNFQAVPVIGPFAELIGGAAGGALGGLFGSKEKSLTQDIHKVTTQLQSIVSDMQAGTISLSQAIQDLRNERQQAIQLLSQNPKGNKGGGKGAKKGYTPDQVQAVIEQFDTQIQALVNQQTQVLDNLTQSLMQLSSPIPFQEYVSNLDQIIQKYQEFASAAQGNTQEMTNANQYLNDSLQQYVVTLSQNLNQAQQQAIQDGLTLINLEYQRQQLINQEAQSEYDVLTQGVLARQRTTAMTKGQEIGVLRYQRDMQLEQINEQISMEQYKVQAETQIFNLATTRIGLETQLLSAQEDQINVQVAQIAALAQIVSDLGTGLSSGNLLQTITSMESGGALPTGSGILYAILQMLGLSGYVPGGVTGGQYGTTNWLSQIPAQYASAAQYVASLDPSFVNDIQAALSAAPDSTARQQAEADINPYIQQGEIEGYDMQGLASWLQSVPAMESGGQINKTGLIFGHQGEWVLPKPIVSMINGIHSFMSSGGGSTSTTASATPRIVGSGSTTDSSSLAVHSKLLSMTGQRANIEMAVITARQSQLEAEANNIQMLQQLYSSMSTGSGPSSIEMGLQKLYEVRGRYGSANFRRETL